MVVKIGNAASISGCISIMPNYHRCSSYLCIDGVCSKDEIDLDTITDWSKVRVPFYFGDGVYHTFQITLGVVDLITVYAANTDEKLMDFKRCAGGCGQVAGR
jgi:hypothetical protein